MKLALTLLASLGMAGACGKASPTPVAEPPRPSTAGEPPRPGTAGEPPRPGPAPAPEPPAAAPSAARSPAAEVAAEVEASMAAFLTYAEGALAILREHGKDCDEAARFLAPRAPVFRELGPRMLKVRDALQSLPKRERERIKRSSDEAMAAFKARNPDADALEQASKACEKSSPAFAEIAPQVMFTKGH